ncbi:glycerol-3-phosphate dehydrogenase [Govanella unica]|uniref:Glycerol-3-phosphate dehydrogenase n=1 Tax=Govanella unica TaxID=2975056 RepID=A0A9X3TVM4_9PROT|nr:glycerol-3-phosphate dehydrogenase [Govania unica]
MPQYDPTPTPDLYDLLIIGGGINGVGIARDAAGRGLRVLLAEAHDLASATSSASSKLIHGGLRYLEQYEFRLVRESLAEREVMLKIAPHLVHPMTFVMPHNKRLRPAWMLRIGLFLYDHMGGKHSLPASRGLDLAHLPEGLPLRPELTRGFSYADCAVDDARLVVVTSMDAAERGAHILTRSRVTSARPENGIWNVTINGRTLHARALVNAAGPWAGTVDHEVIGLPQRTPLRLVKGSHIIVPRLYAGDQAYILQAADRRVIFVMPFGPDHNLIGTTDLELTAMPDSPAITTAEIDYLCATVGDYFHKPPKAADVVGSFAGVRPLYDDGDGNASNVTRDYVLKLQTLDAAPLLSVYGGKLTTHRRLAEAVLHKLAPHFPKLGPAWTATAPLPGGDLGTDSFREFLAESACRYPWLPHALLDRYARAYGDRLHFLLNGCEDMSDLGPEILPGLHAREVAYLWNHEWARTAEDILWRRSKLGLGCADPAPLTAWLQSFDGSKGVSL